MLAHLNQRNFSKLVSEKHGIIIYTFITGHVRRSIGASETKWQYDSPNYQFSETGTLVRNGSFRSANPLLYFFYELLSRSNMLRYFNIYFPVDSDEHYRRTAAIIRQSSQKANELFGNVPFYCVIYPGNSHGRRLMPFLQDSGIRVLDYSELKGWDPKIHKILYDGHPNATGYRLVAEHLAADVGETIPAARTGS